MMKKNGKSICFIGLDGSGKSSSIDAAFDYCKKNGIKVEIVRAAYVIEHSKWIVAIGKKITMHKHSDPYKKNDYPFYLSEMRKTNIHSFKYRVFSFITTLEFKNQIKKRIINKLKNGTNILIDRYIYDNVVTYAANLGLGEEYIEKTMSKKWKNAPKPNAIIYIKTKINTCLSRKNDIPDPLYLQIREPLYDLISNKYNAIVVSGDDSLNLMKQNVISIVKEVFNNGK